MPSKPSVFYAVRTKKGSEIDVALIIENRVRAYNEEARKKSSEETALPAKPVDIRAIIVPPASSEYIYLETSSLSSVYKVITDVKYVKRGAPIKIDKDELIKLIKPKPVIEMISEREVVEIIKGPFRGMKAQVISIDRNKNIVTLSILEAQFNVPITVPADYVKPVKKTGGV